MNLNKMFEMGGLNLWIVASGNGLNLILAGMVLLGVAVLGEEGGGLSQVLLILGTFLSTAFVAFICGRMERERYQSYALYTLPGNLLLTVPGILFGGLMGLMVVVVAVLGALNGARFAEMTVERHAR
jgi:hypothetical protein